MPEKSDNTTKNQRKIGKGMPPEGWKPGESGNPNGRPKKIYSQFKEQGYKLDQINDTYMNMIGLKKDELEAVKDDKEGKYTALEIVVAASLLKSMKDGQLREVETLLTRTHGFPKQQIDTTSNIKMEPVSNKPDRDTLLGEVKAKLDEIDRDVAQPQEPKT